MPKRYETKYKIGQDNIRAWGMDMHNPVFWASATLSIIFVLGSIFFPSQAKVVFDQSKSWSIKNFDWLFLYAGNLFVIFCIALIFSPFGKIRLGGLDSRPEFSRLSWLSMLFAAGMGIGLMFWSVAEPVAYYTGWYGTPLGVVAKSPEAYHLSLGTTLFHWGLHPWSIYAVVGLTLAFFTFNKKLPLTLRSGFYPLMKERSWGIPGHLIDITAVLATLFGLATSLGFGAQQAAGGISFLTGISNDLTLQSLIIVGVTGLAILSVIRGLDGGVKVLSNLNILLAFLLLLVVFAAGPTLKILSTFSDTMTSYVKNIVPLSQWSGREDSDFLHGWTVFYWAWWISWSPFVGMFIARISKGRTIREFLLAVLILPTLVTAFWMSSFGGTALDQVQNGVGALAPGLSDVELALFQMLENLPLSTVTSTLGIMLVLCFFVTSSDSGSLVIDSITAGGKLDAPVPQRIFWASIEGLIAIALLIGGGKEALGALQAAAITVGLPFTLVLIVLCISLFLGLQHEYKNVKTQEPAA